MQVLIVKGIVGSGESRVGNLWKRWEGVGRWPEYKGTPHV